MNEPDRFMRRPEVLELVGVSDSTLYSMIRAHKFPPAIGIGDRCVAWSRRAVLEWMERKVRQSNRRVAA
ncbi:AlpA family phage regulatory protein [Rhodanobacter sp. 115]|uniref:helix-turn-helix transcriptional regulator n=1 Tax=Rhodanobacter sp. FW021-MT20 TaxID=1162282 RepID=UPI0012F876C8|nr:AlpA family phage regulatory protein [Rhodanobacter sp. 115]